MQVNALYDYVKHCTSHVSPNTMLAIVITESSGNQLALNLNKGIHLKYQARNLAQAKHWVRYLEHKHYNFDIGLAQLNINTVHRYGYSADMALNPCLNLNIASNELYQDYKIEYHHVHNSRLALYQSLSLYNTGNSYTGFYNKYVQKVVFHAKSIPPNIQ